MAYTYHGKTRTSAQRLNARYDKIWGIYQEQERKKSIKSPKPDSTTQKGDTLAVDWDTKAKIY